MTLFGVLGALMIGLSLGLLGSGGSIITVPVLLLLFGLEPSLAIVTSLLIVGAIASFGAFRGWRSGRLDRPALWRFALPAMLGATLGGALGSWVADAVQLLIFSLLAAIAAWRMFAGAPHRDGPAHTAWLVPAALFTGLLTGLVGVGGGFLIVPALVLVGGLPMARATATSLPVIALSAFTGFIAYWVFWPEPGGPDIPWATAALVTGCGLLGIVAGQHLAGRLPDTWLRRGFAVVLLVVAVYLAVGTLNG